MRYAWPIALGFIALLGISANLHAAEGPVVRTTDGLIRGMRSEGVDRFLGIPYAQPPIGPLRWAPPVPIKAWVGERDATTYANHCPQALSFNPKLAVKEVGQKPLNEDCLYLNIYRPHGGAKSKPVVVYIHGGGFTVGSGELDKSPLTANMDAGLLAKNADAIVVAMNYRLGVFGFLSLPELSDESPNHASGNYALLDQQAALKWVQKNIAQFGGDPKKVAVLGVSAGSVSAWLHFVSPLAKNLFASLIPMSATPNTRLTRTMLEEQKSGPSAKVARAAGCKPWDNVLKCLRSKSTDEIFEAGGGAKTRDAGWWPIVDGWVVPNDPLKLMESGAVNHVPIMSGGASLEGAFWVHWRRQAGIGPWTEADYATWLKDRPYGAAVAQNYPASAYSTPDDAFVAFTTDIFFAAPTIATNIAAGKAAPVYSFEFDDPAIPGHGVEGAYFFGSMPHPKQLGPEQLKLSERMVADLNAFIRTGRPASPIWNTDGVMIYSPQGDKMISVDSYKKLRHFAFWQALEPSAYLPGQ